MGSESLTTNRKFDSQEQEVYLSLWRTYDRLKAIEDELFGKWQITSQQYNVLRILQAAAPDSVPTLQISNRLISRAPDITRMLDRRGPQNGACRNHHRRPRIAGKTARTCQVSARFPVRAPESNRSRDAVPPAWESQKTPRTARRTMVRDFRQAPVEIALACSKAYRVTQNRVPQNQVLQNQVSN